MTEDAEIPVIRTFADLNAPEKVNAILGAVFEPVSKDLVLDFSGVNYADMKEEERKVIDGVFSSDGVIKSHSEESDVYMLGEEARKKLATTVDMISVHGVIADKIVKDLGLDLKK